MKKNHSLSGIFPLNKDYIERIPSNKRIELEFLSSLNEVKRCCLKSFETSFSGSILFGESYEYIFVLKTCFKKILEEDLHL